MSEKVYILGKEFDSLYEACLYQKIFDSQTATKESVELLVSLLLKDIIINVEIERLTISNKDLSEKLRVFFLNLLSSPSEQR